MARAEAGLNLGEFDRATMRHGLATTMGSNAEFAAPAAKCPQQVRDAGREALRPLIDSGIPGEATLQPRTYLEMQSRREL
ncbi:hypothetical protein [Cupriavidus sp. H39]|uniref:hypothetical protein n=1 Tax=Cupriavidus sp. H39 TaxID=3401635 RepID=UPI003D01352D